MLNHNSESNIKDYFLATWPLFRSYGPGGAAVVMLAWASATGQSLAQLSFNQIVAIYLIGLTQHCNSAEQAWTLACRFLSQTQQAR